MRHFRKLIFTALLLCNACVTADNTGDDRGEINTLFYGLTLEASGFDPHIHSSAELGIVLRQVYDTLVYRHPETRELVAGLAESWRVSTDGRSYEFTLKQGVTFHDETPFNAMAVAANLERILSTDAPASQKAQFLLGPYDSHEVVSEFVIRIQLSEPYTPFLDSLSQVYLAMASPKALSQYSRNRYQFHQVGTGPFRFIEYLPGSHIRLARWAGYRWGPEFYDELGAGNLEEIVFRFYEDPPTRHLALQSGEAQIMGELPPLDAAALNRDEVNLLPTSIPGQPLQFLINSDRAPTDEDILRQALLYATDRATIAQLVYQGFPAVASGPLGPNSLFYDPAAGAQYEFDPRKAVAMLAEAGYRDQDNDGYLERDGVDLTIDLILPNWNFLPDVAQLLKEQWRSLGIRLLLHPVPGYAALLARIEANDYHLAPFNSFGPDPALLNDYFHSEGNRNWSRYANPRVDELLASASQSADPEERSELYSLIQNGIMNEALILPIVEFVNLNAASRHVVGLQFDPYGWFPLLHSVDLLPAEP